MSYPCDLIPVAVSGAAQGVVTAVVMHEALRRLVEVMPPGEGAGDVVDWGEVRRRLGFEFPSDYREFVEVYGAGSINNTFSVVLPLPGEGDARYAMEEATEDGLALIEETVGLDFSLTDRICWAVDFTASHVFWRVQGDDPDRWPVFVLERDRTETHYDCGMVEFLLDALASNDEDSSVAIVGRQRPLFLNWRTESVLRDAGLDPWPEEADETADG